MRRWWILSFGVAAYAAFLATSLYAVGFLGHFGVPRPLDGEPQVAMSTALITNLTLALVFGVQHSVMARRWFKQWLTRLVPASLERSIYVLSSCAALALVFRYWQPMGGTLWRVDHPVGTAALYSVFAAGWLTVVGTSFLINHFDLFGLRQVWDAFRGQTSPPLRFVTPGLYRYVRHPLYIGWLMVFWATPVMTIAHFVLAAAITAYIFVAIPIEERDLIRTHAGYAAYRRDVPMLIPRLRTVKKRRISRTVS